MCVCRGFTLKFKDRVVFSAKCVSDVYLKVTSHFANNHEWSNDIGPVRVHIHQPNPDLQATGERGLWLWEIETFRVGVYLLSLSHEVISGARVGAELTIPIDG